MILPPATLGLLGGGQLGCYFVLAARQLGYRIMLLDPDRNSPAGRFADDHLVADYDDLSALTRMAGICAAVTTEFESIPATTLAHLAQFVPVRPNAKAVGICQNRSEEKAFLRQHGFPHAPYADIRTEQDILSADASLFPGILKAAHFGYDGKGQSRVLNRDQAVNAYRSLFADTPCVLEKMLPLESELSVVLVRDERGQITCFPASENMHSHGILDVSIAPAQGPRLLVGQAEEIARNIAHKLDYIGILGVEFFVVQGQLYVNEMAPRPHNTGHYTLDACRTSQFEQQVRALCGLPLGEIQHHGASVMVNLLGDLWYRDDESAPREPDWSALLSVPNLKLHLYGKQQARPGRKMGHFTVLGADPEQVYETAMEARAAIGIRDDDPPAVQRR